MSGVLQVMVGRTSRLSRVEKVGFYVNFMRESIDEQTCGKVLQRIGLISYIPAMGIDLSHELT